MLKFQNKKLLILNGLALACDIVTKANQKDIYTIVTDKSEHAPAKKNARESYCIPTTDVKAVVKLAKRSQVDGIITGFVDSNLHAARIACESIGFPFYATKDQLNITMNKAKFKQLCRKHDIPTVPEFDFANGLSSKRMHHIKYPVLVKPVDNTGSRGIVICCNQQQLIQGYRQSMQFSATKTVLVEKFMDLSKPGVNLDYVICDGRIHLSAVGDLYTYQMAPNLPPLTSAVYYPSVQTEKYIRTIDPKVRDMFKSIALKNGVIFIQAFYQDDNFYFYEMGYRLGGGQSYQVISRINGVNHLDMLIDFAITGAMCTQKVESKISPIFNKKGLILVLFIRPGRIAKVVGIEEIRKLPEVVNVMQIYQVGDELSPSAVNTTQQSFGRVHVVADTHEQIINTIIYVKKKLEVINDKGEQMLIDTFDVNRLTTAIY